MRNLTATICLTIAVLLGSVGVSESADLQRGVAADKRGDYATALREYRGVAEQGDFFAQTLLGIMYYEGKGVPQNYGTAVRWYTLAAKQGYMRAQSNLGAMYETGRGVPKNYKTALRWQTLAAEQGLSGAQHNLGLMYFRGYGVIKDYVYAYMWWNIAASSGNRGASKNRDIVAKQMTPSQLEKAQDLARECVAKNYKGC